MLTAVAGTADHVPRNRAVWDRWAADYAGPGLRMWTASEPMWGIWNIAEAQVGVLPADLAGRDCIELGCGTGYVSAWLARRGARPAGLDNSAAQLATARRMQDRFGLRFPLIHASASPAPDLGSPERSGVPSSTRRAMSGVREAAMRLRLRRGTWWYGASPRAQLPGTVACGPPAPGGPPNGSVVARCSPSSAWSAWPGGCGPAGGPCCPGSFSRWRAPSCAPARAACSSCRECCSSCMPCSSRPARSGSVYGWSVSWGITPPRRSGAISKRFSTGTGPHHGRAARLLGRAGHRPRRQRVPGRTVLRIAPGAARLRPAGPARGARGCRRGAAGGPGNGERGPDHPGRPDAAGGGGHRLPVRRCERLRPRRMPIVRDLGPFR